MKGDTVLRIVRAVLRTSAGIIVVRAPGELHWRFVEVRLTEAEQDIERAIAAVVELETGIALSPAKLHRLSRSGRIATYAADVDDITVMANIRSIGMDGTSVKELAYAEAAAGVSLAEEPLAFLRAHSLLTPP